MALTYLDSLAGKPGVDEDRKLMQQYFEKKYWHELTELLLTVVKKPEWDEAATLLELYTKFITHFQLKINLFKLGQLMQIVADRQERATAANLLKETAGLVKDNGDIQAYHLTRCEEAYHRVMMGVESEKRLAKDIVADAVAYLDRNEASTVHVDLRAAIYRSQAVVFKVEANHDSFYRTCLLYIAHKRTEDMPLRKQQEVAFDLGIAALLGKETHNFGELIHHPILDSLRETDHKWLADILCEFNTGNLEAYGRIAEEHADMLRTHIGDANAPFLRQKIQLMALLQHLFVTPVHSRTLSFEVIHKKCKTDSIKDVEPLLLRALALGLIRGSIDEVHKVIEVTWIAARALGRAEVSELIGSMKSWNKQVQQTLTEVQNTMQMHETEA